MKKVKKFLAVIGLSSFFSKGRMEELKKVIAVFGLLTFCSFVVVLLMNAWIFISYVLEGNNYPNYGYPNYGAESMLENIISWPWYVLVALGAIIIFSFYYFFSYNDETKGE